MSFFPGQDPVPGTRASVGEVDTTWRDYVISRGMGKQNARLAVSGPAQSSRTRSTTYSAIAMLDVAPGEGAFRTAATSAVCATTRRVATRCDTTPKHFPPSNLSRLHNYN